MFRAIEALGGVFLFIRVKKKRMMNFIILDNGIVLYIILWEDFLNIKRDRFFKFYFIYLCLKFLLFNIYYNNYNYFDNNNFFFISASIAVLPRLIVDSLQTYGVVLRERANDPEIFGKEASFVLLQLINALKFLQAQGIEEVPLSLSSFAICRDDRESQPRLCILQVSTFF